MRIELWLNVQVSIFFATVNRPFSRWRWVTTITRMLCQYLSISAIELHIYTWKLPSIMGRKTEAKHGRHGGLLDVSFRPLRGQRPIKIPLTIWDWHPGWPRRGLKLTSKKVPCPPFFASLFDWQLAFRYIYIVQWLALGYWQSILVVVVTQRHRTSCVARISLNLKQRRSLHLVHNSLQTCTLCLC